MSRIGLRVEADAAFALRDPGTADRLRRYGFDEVREVVALADRLGYDSVWLPEGFGRDAVTFLTALGLHTERVRLATGILSTYTRTPTMTAMSAATIDELTGGRFVLGLGVGHEPMTEGGHGVPFDRPITRGRETIEIVRRLLAGERVTYEGKVFSTSGAQIDVRPVQQPLPVYLAALKPKMVRLAGEIADGVLLNFSPKEYVEEAVGLVREGEAAAGREPARATWPATCGSRSPTTTSAPSLSSGRYWRAACGCRSTPATSRSWASRRRVAPLPPPSTAATSRPPPAPSPTG